MNFDSVSDHTNVKLHQIIGEPYLGMLLGANQDWRVKMMDSKVSNSRWHVSWTTRST